MKKQLLVFILSISLFSCQHEEVDPKERKFTVQYYFINQGDSKVQNVHLSTTTYFPQESQVCFFDRTFQAVEPIDTLYKKIEGPNAYQGYIGCKTYMKVIVVFKEPVYSPFADPYLASLGKDNQAFKRTFESTYASIATVDDSSITFKWPSDTLYFKEVAY